jgi:hypothetical protein
MGYYHDTFSLLVIVEDRVLTVNITAIISIGELLKDQHCMMKNQIDVLVQLVSKL